MNLPMTRDISAYVRCINAAILAAILTLCLFFLMQALVRSDDEAPPLVELPPIPEFVIERPPVTAKIEPLERPSEREAAPHKPTIETGVESSSIAVFKPTLTVEHARASINLHLSQIPVAQGFKSPDYPQAAIRREIEGWVDIRFDVNPLGRVENLQVVAAQPEGVFEKSVLQAAQHWRYQPRMNANGEADYSYGMTKRLVFELEN